MSLAGGTRVRPASIEAVVGGVRNSVGNVATAASLPSEVYTSPEFYEFEREAVFCRSWLFVCHTSQVPRPGDRYAADLAGEPVIVTRDELGDLHVLSAVCQHRGYVIDDCEQGRLLRCPYHSWTYTLDGRLAGAPSMHPAHELDRLRREIRLPEWRVEIWHGMVFATLDPTLAPLADTAAAAGAAIAPYRLADMVVADEVTISDLPFNWKNMQENALEEYHTTYIHRGFHENVPAHLVVHGTFDSGAGAVYRHAGMIIKGGEPVPGRPLFPVIDGLPEFERGHFVFIAVPPMWFGALRPDGVKMFRINPNGPDRTSLTIQFLFPPATLELPDFESMMARQIELIDLIDGPDLLTNARVHRGMRSRFAPRGPLSPQESSLPQFNQWLLERYSAALDSRVAAEATA